MNGSGVESPPTCPSLSRATRRLPPTIRATLAATLQPCDVLLVEGNTRFSKVIKTLTQSTWSHACICIGDALGPPADGSEPNILLEVDVLDGVRVVPLSMYARFHTRICRPVSLTYDDRRRIVDGRDLAGSATSTT